MKIAIIGLGNIGLALVQGLSLNSSLFYFDKNEAKVQKVFPKADEQNTVEEVVKNADIIFLCIRTSQVEDFLRQHGSLLAKKAIVFFQVGLSLSDVSLFNLDQTVLIRAITNVNVASKNGYTVLLKNKSDKEYAAVYKLLQSVGHIREAQTENELESVALLPGCSPAIVSLLVHYLEEISATYSTDIISNKEAIFAAVTGTIATMRHSGSPSLEIAKSVATPGGTVEKAVSEIVDNQNFEHVLTGFFDKITKH